MVCWKMWLMAKIHHASEKHSLLLMLEALREARRPLTLKTALRVLQKDDTEIVGTARCLHELGIVTVGRFE